MAIGMVRGLIGKVTVTDSRGSVRELRVGDAVELNDNVQAQAGGTVHIVFNNGNFATIGSNESLLLNEAVMDPTAAVKAADGQSVADIQAMIAAGMDPTQIAEATAAGADAGLAGETGQGGHSFVVVNQDAARGEVTPGFDTNTFGRTVLNEQRYTGGDLYLETPENEEVNNVPVIDMEASSVSLEAREAGVKGDDAGIPGDSPNAEYGGTPVAGGKIVASDPDGDALSFTVKPTGTDGNGADSADGKYGSITIDAEGNYTYTLNNDKAQSLSQGETDTETFTILVSDGRGGMVEQVITVTVTGTNDAPDLSIKWGDGGNGVTEDGTGRIDGTFRVSDDDGDGGRQTLTISGKDGTTGNAADGLIDGTSGNPASFETDYGKLTLNPDGTYHYELKNDSEAVQKMGEGDSHTETFDITVTDIHGSSHTETITVVVNGTNDAPVVTQPGSGELFLKEAGVGTVEQGGKPGWAESDYNHAIAGTPKAESSFTVKDVDAGDKLTASIVDADGKPVAGVVTNPDTGVMTLETEYGTLTVTPSVNGDGSITYTYSFELNANADGLSEGQDIHYEYRIEVSDGHQGGTVTENVHIKIEGTNDAPVVKHSNIHVKEDGVFNGNNETTGDNKNNGAVNEANDRLTATGKVPFSDVDKDADLTLSASLKGADKDGNLTVQVTDNGNRPIAGAEESIRVTGQHQDPDNPAIQVLETNFGTLTLNTVTGDYTFALNAEAAQHLAQGEKFVFSFNVTATDNHGAVGSHMIGVTVEGANDRPTLSVDATLDANQGGTEHSVSGWAHGADADRGAELSYSFGMDSDGKPVTSIETPYGTMEINPQTGEYTFTVNPDAPAFSELGDKSASLDFTVQVTDEHGAHSEADVTVNVQGNRVPEIVTPPEDADGLFVKESGQVAKGEGVPDNGYAEGNNQTKVPGILTDGDSFTVRDADSGDKLKATLTDAQGKLIEGVVTDGDGKMTLVTDYGILTVTPTVNADGTVTYEYRFDLDDKAANSLSEGETIPLDFVIRVSDSSGASVSQGVNVTIEGTNDKPVVKHTTIQVKEDGVFNGNNETTGDGKSDGAVLEANDRLTATGKVPFSDVDKDADLTLSASLKGADKDGNVTVQVTDNGNKPVAGAEESIKVTGSHPDGDNLDVQVLETNYGELRLNTLTGEYTFSLNTEMAQHLAAGEKFVFQFTVTATDSHGAQGHHEIGVTVEGANDRPTLTLDHDKLDVSNSPDDVVSGSAHGQDADRGAELSYGFADEKGKTSTEMEGLYGKIEIDAEGNYKYTLNPDSEAYKALGKDGGTEEFTIRVTDEHGAYSEQTVTVTVTGDAGVPPAITEHLEVNEAGLNNAANTSESAVLNAPDGYTITGAKDGEYGKVTYENGQWKYTLDKAFTHEPGNGTNTELGADTIKVTFRDENGREYEVEIKVDITDDVPTVNTSTDMVGSVGDDHLYGTVGDLSFGADAEGGQSITVGGVTATYDGESHQWTFEGGNGGSVDTSGHLNFNLPDGSLNLDTGTGNVVFTPDSGHATNNVPQLDIVIKDGDGDIASGHINIGVADSSGPDKPTGSTETEIKDSTNNVIIKGDGAHDGVNDVIVGDYAGNTTVGSVQDVVNNIYMAVDVSDSMNDRLSQDDPASRLKVVADALDKLFEQMNAADADPHTSVNVTLSIFSGAGSDPKTFHFSVQEWAGKSANDIFDILNNYKHGDTSFEAPLKNASDWANSVEKGEGIYNKVIFITDATGAEMAYGAAGSKSPVYLDNIMKNGVEIEALSIVSHYQTTYKDMLDILVEKYPDVSGKQPFEQALMSLLVNLRHDLPGITDTYLKLFGPLGYSDEQIHQFIQDSIATGTGKYGFDPSSLYLLTTAYHSMTEIFKGSTVIQADSADDVNSSLDIGSVIPKPVTYAPGSDLISGGSGDDIIFGDADLASLKSQVAGLMHVDVKDLSNADLFNYISQHPDLFDRPDSAFGAVDNGLADALIGGAGNDILYGQGGNDILIGDGTHDSLSDITNYLHDHGVAGMDHLDFSAGHDLGQNISALGDALHHMGTDDLNQFANWAQDHLGAGDHKGGGDLLYGGSGDDVLIGGSGNDVLHGGDGNDILMGGHGNDTLIGGHGDNILIGGSGNDTFKYNAGDFAGKENGDTITDFHVGNLDSSKGAVDHNADILDLKDLLTGADKLEGGASDLIHGGYLKFDDIHQNDDGSVTVKLSIDSDGLGGSADFHTLATITMNGVHLGNDPGQHAQELLNQLVQNNEIKI